MFTYNELTIAVVVVLGAIAVFNMCTAAVKGWKELRKPDVDLRETVEKHDRALKSDGGKLDDHEQRISHLEGCCSEVQSKLQNDWQFQQDETEMNRLMLKSIKQLLKHSIDGNDTSGLKHMEDEIDNYLVDHAQ